MNKREHINEVEMVGRLGHAPEVKRTEEGTPYVRLSIATSERFTTRDGEVRDRTEWHNAVAWGKTAEDIGRELNKGDSVALSGSLRVNSYEKDGSKNRVTEVTVSEAKKNLDNAPSKNESRLVGVVREEPRVHELSGGRAMTTVSLATRSVVNGRDREDWHSVTLWGKAAEAAGREIKQGDTLAINGPLRHRTLGNEGQERKLSAIDCRTFQVLERVQDMKVAPPTRRSGKSVERGM